MPKNVFTMMFCNKGMEQISLNRILKSEESITHFPGKFVKIVTFQRFSMRLSKW